MCITVKGRFRVLRNLLGRKYGFKVFRLFDDGTYGGELCGKKVVRPEGSWLDAKDFAPTSYEKYSVLTPDYVPGWHVFKKKADAEIWRDPVFAEERVVVKVFVRKVREKGFLRVHGDFLDCFIADRIFISSC